ncbi:hypothetical protein HG530_011396 [Fusarium avenaceum]|nr:hypothetical protein HG530_011396 [Fusarium avenaceum]
MVRGHGIAGRDEVAPVKIVEVAESIVHHHEHLLGMPTRAEDEEVVIHRAASPVERRLPTDLYAATTLDELNMTGLVLLVRSAFDDWRAALTVRKIEKQMAMSK